VVKAIAPENTEGLSAERFAREVKLAARLQQANIVPVLAAGTSGNLPYYTMPFVRGESLRTRLASGASLSIPEPVSILRDVARALAHAHAELRPAPSESAPGRGVTPSQPRSGAIHEGTGGAIAPAMTIKPALDRLAPHQRMAR